MGADVFGPAPPEAHGPAGGPAGAAPTNGAPSTGAVAAGAVPNFAGAFLALPYA